MAGPPVPDRPAAIRAALRALVAERGFHGATMGAVARRAGVAAGTAYVHYDSKDEVVLAAYAEAKRRLGIAAVAAIDAPESPRARFVQMWLGAHDHLRDEPEDARFLLQVDCSPYAAAAHDRVTADGDDPVMVEATRSGLWASLVALPLDVLYDLAFAPVVRLAAREHPLERADLRTVAVACWAAVSSDDP